MTIYYFLLLDTMKQKLSISIDEKLIAKIEAKLKQGVFRNKSHVIEYAVMQLLRK